MQKRPFILTAVLPALTLFSASRAADSQMELATISGIDRYRTSAYPSVARLDDGALLCVYSAHDPIATKNKAVIVGVISRDGGKAWSDPRVLIDSRPELDYDPNIIVVSQRVIVTSTTVPPTHGQFISTSRTMAVRSEDNAKTWSKPSEIPMGHRYTAGKIHNGVKLANGDVLFPFSWDVRLQKDGQLKSEGDEECRAAVMISHDRGDTWTSGQDARLEQRKLADRSGAINGLDEPAIVTWSDGSLYMLCRTGLDHLFECRSRDGGQTWSAAVASPLVGHNAPASLCRITGPKPGILVVWDNSSAHRWPLCASASFDDAHSWTAPMTLAESPGFQASYPGCIEVSSGRFIVVWQQDLPKGGREIRSALFGLDALGQATSQPENTR